MYYSCERCILYNFFYESNMYYSYLVLSKSEISKNIQEFCSIGLNSPEIIVATK